MSTEEYTEQQPEQQENQKDWDGRYRNDDTPWDSGLPSAELRHVLDEQNIAPCRVLEIGCGTGSSAIYLASQGFTVTAIDISPTAIETARARAAKAGVAVDFVVTHIGGFESPAEPFDFIFDRGAFHCIRKVYLQGLLVLLKRVTRPGTRYLTLTGNSDELSTDNMPRLRAADLCSDLEELFKIDQLRAFYFEDAPDLRGPLGWSCLMTRRGG